MTFCIVVVLAVFCWLMYETKWLTVRLPFGKPMEEVNLTQLVAIAVAFVIAVNLVLALVKLPREGIIDVGGKK